MNDTFIYLSIQRLFLACACELTKENYKETTRLVQIGFIKPIQ